MKASRFSDSQIIAVLKQAEVGTPVPELCREHGISSATFYKWRSRFGGMAPSLMSQLKELKDENRRLKEMYAESQLSADLDLLKEAMAKKMARRSQRRGMARWAVEDGRTSIWHACLTFEVSQTCYRYQAKAREENARIADWLVRLTTTYRDWGFGLCFLHLRHVKTFGWNHKRVYRIYRELELTLRIKPRKRMVREKPEPLAVPATINQVWSMAFMHDQLGDGRSFRLFNVLGDFNREGLAIEIDLPLPSAQVIRALEQIIEWRGAPKAIRCDNGPEYISGALQAWAQNRSISLEYIQPGRPQQNAYIERYNRTVRYAWLGPDPVRHDRTGAGHGHSLAMDLQPRAPEHGALRHHAHAEVGTRRIAPFLTIAKIGGLPFRLVLKTVRSQIGSSI